MRDNLNRLSRIFHAIKSINPNPSPIGVKEFGLQCFGGEEKNKRLLMRNMIHSDSSGFALNDEIQLLTFHYQFWNFRKDILQILVEKNNLFTNDYTLNNIALHLIVMIDRIRNDGRLDYIDPYIKQYKTTPQYLASIQLADYLCNTYNIEITEAEILQLFITVSNNTSVIDHNTTTIANVRALVDPFYVSIAENVLLKVEQTYYLESFDDSFKSRFMIHVNNLFNRMKNDYSIRNPLTLKIKSTYPLIYDISVFIAQEFQNEYNIHLSEDEIAFIALHLGGYFENNLSNLNKVSCIFVYADYYGNYNKNIEKISKLFSNSLFIKHIVSAQQYRQDHLNADLIISSMEMEFMDRHCIINPFLTDDDIDTVRRNIESIQQKKKNTALKKYFSDFVNPNLFYKNPAFKNKNDAITCMTENTISLGLAIDTLTESVLQRECLSDTGFNGIAVPHSLNEDVLKSFISFAICDTPMMWGNKQIYIIALIGVNKDSRRAFTEVFDFLIDILSEIQNIKELANSVDYDTFIKKLLEQLDNK